MDAQATGKKSAEKASVQPEVYVSFDGKNFWQKAVRPERHKIWIVTLFLMWGLLIFFVMAYYAARFFGE